ncbi:MAG: dihydrodipicolinate synthase family protein [Solirubrobacteraceae bacterium]
MAATVTPLRDGGRQVNADAVPVLVDFYAAARISGVLVAGTTGEGLLLSTGERMALAESFLQAARGRLAVAVHAGAQTTAEAVSLAGHARDLGADAVAAIGPPYYRYDDDELLAHFRAIASASAPVPFYLYEFRDRTGYALPDNVVRTLAASEPNLVGIKVSDRSLGELRTYMLPELDVFVASEALIPEALAMGAVGAVSGLAAAMPHAVLRIVAGSEPADHAAFLREGLAAYPLQGRRSRRRSSPRACSTTRRCGRRCAASPPASGRGAWRGSPKSGLRPSPQRRSTVRHSPTRSPGSPRGPRIDAAPAGGRRTGSGPAMRTRRPGPGRCRGG